MFGERRLPAGSFRQPAENIFATVISNGLWKECSRQAAGYCGLAARAPLTSKFAIARRDRQHSRRVRYPEGISQ
jgi:hypothetical protein